MLKRLLFFGYGLTCYLIFLGTFLYAIAFVGGFFVPRRLDGPLDSSTGLAVVIDCALLTVFAVQHSIMARQWFKRGWTRIIPRPIERSTYVLLASACLILIFWQWRPMTGVVWEVHSGAGRTILLALCLLGWLTVLVCTFLIDHFDLFGLRQVTGYLLGRPYQPPHFVMPLVYRIVRHPLYLGFLFAFWAAPRMTYGHLLFSIATTGYILIAIQLEEQDLIGFHGDSYRKYREHTPMLVPFTKR